MLLPTPFLLLFCLKEKLPVLKGSPVNRYLKQHWSGRIDDKQIKMNLAHLHCSVIKEIRLNPPLTSPSRGQNPRAKLNTEAASLLERLFCILAVAFPPKARLSPHNISSVLILYWPRQRLLPGPQKTFISKDYLS